MGGGPRLAEAFPRARTLGERLLDRGLSVACAESCSGGLLSATLTAVPGSSRYLRGGIVAYANDTKISLLGVDADLLQRLGAVSPQVAEAMAVGVAARLGADLGLAITGIAGPGSEGTGKPVGLIYVGACLGSRTQVVELRESGDRENNRSASVTAALALAERMVDSA
jgi:PncC family amidohydrolase